MQLFFFVFLLLSLSFSQTKECTNEDFKGSYTVCDEATNSRNLIYYKTPQNTCQGGVNIPNNIFGLPCDIKCGSGFYLPLGATSCSVCEAGTFSIGGGIQVGEWTGFPQPAGTTLNFVADATHPWFIQNDRPTVLVSPAIPNSASTTLELQIFLITEGSISFQYLVESEHNYDFFTFSVNHEEVVRFSGTSPAFQTFTKQLDRGYHYFIWRYEKDGNLSYGSDNVAIKTLVINGMKYANDICSSCPKGTFSASGAHGCDVCPQNSFSIEKSSECSPCSDQEYAEPGSGVCKVRTECTPADMVSMFTDCTANDDGSLSRTQSFHWSSSTICNTASSALPSPKNVDCAACPFGYYRPSLSPDCVKCSPGMVYNKQTQTCEQCAEGTASYPRLVFSSFTSWEDYPLFTTESETQTQRRRTEGNSESVREVGKGWEIVDGVLMSGRGLGVVYSSTLFVDFSLETDGYFFVAFTFEWNMLSIFVDDVPKAFFYTTTNYRIELPKGSHQVKFVYYHETFSGTNFAKIDEMIIYGVSSLSGSSEECVVCSLGSFSKKGAEYCTPCAPGTYSDLLGSTSCSVCAPGTFSSVSGSVECLPCGTNTYSATPPTTCEHFCGLTTVDGIVYDLSPLQKLTGMHGPVIDDKGMSYYTNVCSMTTPTTSECFDSLGTPIESFACQITTDCGGYNCRGVDLGNIIGFTSLSDEYASQDGLAIKYSHGTPCGSKFREMTISVLCDPNIIVGSPEAPSSKVVEEKTCEYELIWKTVYGCPVCTANDVTFTLTQCVDGMRQKIAKWKDNPKRCHSGIELPLIEMVDTDCRTNVICKSGEYVTEDKKCALCPAGSFSSGAARYYKNLDTFPSIFTTDCTNPGCSVFVLSHGVFVSGRGTSKLRAIAKILFPSDIMFKYLLNVSGDDSYLLFSIDGKIVHYDNAFTSIEEIEASFAISEGTHIFEWTFVNGEPNFEDPQHAFVTIKSITIGGEDYSSSTCSPCSSGMYQSEGGQGKCLRCPANYYSAQGATGCSHCASTEYSFPGSSQCSLSSLCTLDDYNVFSTSCENGETTTYYKIKTPQFCVDNPSLTFPTTRIKCECPSGMYRINEVDHACSSCQIGQYYSPETKQCEFSAPGSIASPSLVFYPVAKGHQATSFAPGWTTSCVGECFDEGMQISANGITPGYLFTALNKRFQKVLKFTLENEMLLENPVLQFNTVGTIPQSTLFEVYFDGIRQTPTISGNTNTIKMNKSVKVISFSFTQSGLVNQSVGKREDFSEFSFNEIIISGVSEVGIAAYNAYATTIQRKCPSGSVSSSGDVVCVECSKGSYESNGQCEKCAGNTFSSVAGSTACNPCFDGTVSNPEKTECIVPDCSFVFEKETFRINGTEIIGPLALSSTSTLYLSPCALTSNFAKENVCNKIYSHACVETTTTDIFGNIVTNPQNFGSQLKFVPDQNEATSFALSYSSPDDTTTDCPTGRSTVIVFVCNTESSVPRFLSTSPCSPIVYWNTPSGCRICNEEVDYEEVSGGCTGGQKIIRLTRKQASLCNGAAVLSERSESCNEVQMPFYWIIIALGVLVLLIVGLSIAIFRHRRISQKYNKLIEHHPDELDEFDFKANDSEEKEI